MFFSIISFYFFLYFFTKCFLSRAEVLTKIGSGSWGGGQINRLIDIATYRLNCPQGLNSEYLEFFECIKFLLVAKCCSTNIVT